MSDDVSTVTVDGAGREFRDEAEWRALMADFERWDGSQVSFCDARGVSRKTFQGWRRRLGLTAGKPRGKRRARPDGFVEIAAASGPGWEIELSLGDGMVLRLRRS